ncbi:MAG: DNA polymerase III subunit gamma/tau [Candidatus Pacebacteria bacterium]|nr:DNA polymerase III subunit gamma/tau [Candidatus Paceibacterota bacterium]
MSLALYRKYRPSGFDEVVGQEHVVRTLKNSIKNGKVAHAYLFSGPRGTGKTSIARILAKTVNCEKPKDGEPCNECQICKDINNGQFLDLVEIDAATHTQVDKMRDIIERINFSPSQGKKKVYIVDEVHMLSKGAFNALLKTLEEPPEHVIFILATTEIHKIPATIISRCQRFDFRHLRIDEMKKRLGEIAETEKVEVEDGVLDFIAMNSGGGMRDSESLFGQIISLQDDGKITLQEVKEILALPDSSLTVDFVSLVLGGKYAEALAFLDDSIVEGGYDLFQFNKSVVEYLRKLLLVKLSPGMRNRFSSEMTGEQLDELEKFAGSIGVSDIFKIISSFIKSQSAIKGAILSQLPLELAIAEIEIAQSGALTERPRGDYNSKVGSRGVENSIKSQPELKKPQVKESVQIEEAKAGEIVEGVDVETSEKVGGEEEKTEDAEEKKSETPASFEALKEEWSEIVQDVRKCNNSLTACLKTCQPIMMENGQIIVACQYSFHKDKLQKVENRAAVEQVASEAVKAQVRLKFISKEDAQRLGFEMEEVHLEEKQAEDLVNSALDMFGGEVVA